MAPMEETWAAARAPVTKIKNIAIPKYLNALSPPPQRRKFVPPPAPDLFGKSTNPGVHNCVHSSLPPLKRFVN
jgi:hypothetical protein